MELKQNMEFELTKKFIPNFCNAKTLKVIDFNDSTVRIEMEDARSRGVFPRLQFLSLIRTGALIIPTVIIEQEDTA
ncbi:hypothetical protein [Litchfieldia salsa]|uniref:Uncharacterized protein n=1 Tax=Litchfieldia salsa TaxID=930152 RepID=A0A1H0TDL8_9BACI|nr:hypothetical protein [Litchfieldia salsa]SDP52099.1 hypothetical protein SAMN05216565_103445 [Litchfieldia salsa]